MPAVGLATLLRGYREAYVRWMAGPRISADPDEAFLTIFEALNWAVVVDDHLRRALPAGKAWSSGYPHGDVVPGFRYARNAVHHDWSLALHVTDGVFLPTPLPTGLFDWCWQPRLPATKPRGETQYRKHLAEKPVRFTLEVLDTIYGQASAGLI
jgi:hypothetical protein